MISVLLPVRRAEATIAKTVESLLAQCVGQDVEVILAVCQGDQSLSGLVLSKPLRALNVKGPAGVPQLRRAAAAVACGDYLVITEDHCRFPVDWLSGLVQAAARNAGAVCGGPVDNGRDTLAGWAQYFTRYSAFLPVGPERAQHSLPGNNAVYPRALIDRHPALLNDGFWEAEFNAELARSGVPFVLIPELAVSQNQHRGAGEYIPLRFRHGRCYGARRFAGSSNSAKAKLLLLCPILPALLYWRMLRAVWRARWKSAKFLASTPLILIYVCAWCVGEVTGYLAGPGQSCTETD